MVYRETFNFDILDAGVIIGKQGAGIAFLKQLPGVHKVFFDTKSSNKTCKLQISGVDRVACQKAYEEVKKKVEANKSTVREDLHVVLDHPNSEYDLIKLSQFGSLTSKTEPVMIGNRIRNNDSKVFTVSAFKKSTIAEQIESSLTLTEDSKNIKEAKPVTNSRNITNFTEMSETDFAPVFSIALKKIDKFPKRKLGFKIRPGKLLFVGPKEIESGLERKQLCSKESGAYLAKHELKTFFTPNLNPDFHDQIIDNLLNLGFDDLSDEMTKTSATVFFSPIGKKQCCLSVRLSDEKDAENSGSTDISASFLNIPPEKREIVEQIMSAKTIGEVFPNVDKSKLKLEHFKKKKLVNPENNSHKNAKDAFAVLNDAFEKLQNGEPSSTLTLKIEQPEQMKSSSAKITKVKTNRNRLCLITSLSDKEFDWRASLLSCDIENETSLSPATRKVAHECWEGREKSGFLPKVPEGSEETIEPTCMKQLIESSTWAKEISAENASETELLLVKVKKIKQKSKFEEDWQDSVTVTMRLERDPVPRDSATLARELKMVKENFKVSSAMESFKINTQSGKGTPTTQSIGVEAVYDFLETKSNCSTLTEESIRKMKFVFFFGFDRSGSTVLGKVIDAHPHALIAIEYPFFDELAGNLTVMEAVDRIFKWSTSKFKTVSKPEGYKISMGSLSGKFVPPLQVIGVKRSKTIVKMIQNDPEAFKRGINKLQSFGLQIVAVSAVRNPFDMIVTLGFQMPAVKTLRFTHPITGQIVWATMRNSNRLDPPIDHVKFRAHNRKALTNGEAKIANKQDVDELIGIVANIANTSDQLMKSYDNFKYITVQNEDLIKNPIKNVRKVCSILGIESYNGFE